MTKTIMGVIQLLAGILFFTYGGTDFHIGIAIVLGTMGIVNIHEASLFNSLIGQENKKNKSKD